MGRPSLVSIGTNGDIGLQGIQELERFAALVREDEREKFTAVGEVKDGSFGGFVWNEGITSDEAPDGAVLYVRSMK
jgi:hypothetical protein